MSCLWIVRSSAMGDICTCLSPFFWITYVFGWCKCHILSQKNNIVSTFLSLYHNIPDTRTHNFCIILQALVLLSDQCVPFWQQWRICLIYRGDWLSIKFCEKDSFRKLFLFIENTFQYLREISQDISVSHFNSRRSLTSANRRRSSTLPILFVSFTQPCDQHDRKIRTMQKRCAMAQTSCARL